MIKTKILFSLIVIIGLISCGPHNKKMKSGNFLVYEIYTLESFEEIKNRASFEFDCPKEKINVVILNTYSNGPTPSQIGASGCNKKAVYIRSNHAWVMNTETTRSKK